MTLFFLLLSSPALSFTPSDLLTLKHFLGDEGLHFAASIREFSTKCDTTWVGTEDAILSELMA